MKRRPFASIVLCSLIALSFTFSVPSADVHQTLDISQHQKTDYSDLPGGDIRSLEDRIKSESSPKPMILADHCGTTGSTTSTTPTTQSPSGKAPTTSSTPSSQKPKTTEKSSGSKNEKKKKDGDGGKGVMVPLILDIITKTPDDKPPVVTPDEEIFRFSLDIHPVQVVQSPPHEDFIEDIPLVVSKKTMVRVFVLELLSGMDQVKNAKACLQWNDEPEECLYADLYRYDGRIWVIPQQPQEYGPYSPPLSHYNDKSDIVRKDREAEKQSQALRLLNGGATLKEKEKEGILKNIQDRYWAFNFTYECGKLAPDNLVLKARLEIDGVVIAKRTEKSGREFKITRFAWGGPFEIVVAGRSFKGSKLNRSLSLQVPVYEHQMLSIFPIPENQINTTLIKNLIPDPNEKVDYTSTKGSYTDTLLKKYPAADTIIVVTKGGKNTVPVKDLDGTTEGWTPDGQDRVHYLDESAEVVGLLAAHETGHDEKYFGAGHINYEETSDGWDAGCHLRDLYGSKGFSDTTRGRFGLMVAGNDKKANGHRNWILEKKEYCRLIKIMTAGANCSDTK